MVRSIHMIKTDSMGYRMTLCGYYGGRRFKHKTTNPRQVTCKNCQRAILKNFKIHFAFFVVDKTDKVIKHQAICRHKQDYRKTSNLKKVTCLNCLKVMKNKTIIFSDRVVQ